MILGEERGDEQKFSFVAVPLFYEVVSGLTLFCHAQTLKELQSYTEAWAGMELTPAIAYGFRLYQNNSVLNMHVDKKQVSPQERIGSRAEKQYLIIFLSLNGHRPISSA